ncbi:MAG: MBL fold metallo-hydrolase [Bacteroidales bacterium]|nr:MBL fold metallo-hydrolase [Bacteroidales bacterium]
MKDHLFFAGQAGFVIESASGCRMGIDLYLSNVVQEVEGHDGYKRLVPSVLEPDNCNLDVIIATHFHRDHFDIGSMGTLMGNDCSILFCPQDCKKDVDDLGIDSSRVVFVKPGDTHSYKDFCIHFVSCDHGDAAPLAVGVIVEVDGKLVYETGDTCLRIDRISEYLQFGHINLMIAPINGMYGNMNEEDCSQLSYLIKPDITIPCHFGMFASHMGSPGRFIEIMREKGLHYLLMAVGEDYIF